MRLRSLALLLFLVLGTPSFAAFNRDDPGPRDQTPRIVKLIKHLWSLIRPLDDPYITPPRP